MYYSVFTHVFAVYLILLSVEGLSVQITFNTQIGMFVVSVKSLEIFNRNRWYMKMYNVCDRVAAVDVDAASYSGSLVHVIGIQLMKCLPREQWNKAWFTSAHSAVLLIWFRGMETDVCKFYRYYCQPAVTVISLIPSIFSISATVHIL